MSDDREILKETITVDEIVRDDRDGERPFLKFTDSSNRTWNCSTEVALTELAIGKSFAVDYYIYEGSHEGKAYKSRYIVAATKVTGPTPVERPSGGEYRTPDEIIACSIFNSICQAAGDKGLPATWTDTFDHAFAKVKGAGGRYQDDKVETVKASLEGDEF